MSLYSVLPEMYTIRDIIDVSNISFRVILIDEAEYKFLDGIGPNCRNKATKINREPLRLIDDVTFNSKSDFIRLVPFTSEEEFTADDYKKKTRLSIDDSRKAILVLMKLGVVIRTGKVGRKYKYKLA